MPAYVSRGINDAPEGTQIVLPGDGMCMDLAEIPNLDNDHIIFVACEQGDVFSNVYEIPRPKEWSDEIYNSPEAVIDILEPLLNEENLVSAVNHEEGFAMGLGRISEDESFWMAVTHRLLLSLDHDGTQYGP